MKLSPSAITTFFDSPAKFYWRYLYQGRGLESLEKSEQNYDHDLVVGGAWSAFVHRFYQGMLLEENRDATLAEWMKGSEGWVSPKVRGQYTDVLSTLAEKYYTKFSPDDGVRSLMSEQEVSNELFYGTPDGVSSEKVIHECKLTTRAKSLTAQYEIKYLHSIQIKVYAVILQATGACIELAFKDNPPEIIRMPVEPIAKETLDKWSAELAELHSAITNMKLYPCNPAGCSIVGKYSLSLCPFKGLCDGKILESEIAQYYKLRENNR